MRRLQVLYALVTMLCYFALGMLCLILIRMGQFRPWMVWPSAAGDCLFILSGAWLGLQNTGLTSDYLVILPTLWLIPVVLAIGVLRFNPSVQSFTIVFLVLGLIFLARQYPTLSAAPQDAVDVFFAEPPNIMRLAMIAIAGVVMIGATWRMRSLFRRALRETEQRVNLTRYVPSEVAPQLAHAGLQALQGGRRQTVAVMFVDMRGFTARAEKMEPEALTQFVTRYRSHVTQAAREQNGIVDKFVGDAVLLIFTELPDAEEPSARAIACGRSVLDRMKNWSTELAAPVSVGVGIHFGEVFAGVIGDQERLEYSVFGDTVNIAARLEELTKTSGTDMIVSERVLDHAQVCKTPWHRLHDETLRGRTTSLRIYGFEAAV